MNNIKELARIISHVNSDDDAYQLLLELFTPSELCTLSKRWQILNLLSQGTNQRDIATQLKVSLCKVTRGAKILKKTNAIVKQYLNGDNKDDKHNTSKNAKQGWILRRFRRTIHQ